MARAQNLEQVHVRKITPILKNPLKNVNIFVDFPERSRASVCDLWANDTGKCLNTCVALVSAVSVSWSVWSSSFIM